MENELQRYVSRTVEIIYIDRNNQITQRIVEVQSIANNLVRAFCLTQSAPRVFKIENILAVNPLTKKRIVDFRSRADCG